MNPYPSSKGDAALLANVLSYLKTKNGFVSSTISTNPVVQAIASAAAGIIATASGVHGTAHLDQALITPVLRQWASGVVDQNEIALPQLIAARLLWADTIKNGS